MAAQAGKNMLLKDGTGTGATLIAGLRAKSIDIDGDAVDVTNLDSNGFRELLSGAGIAKASIKFEGVVTDSTQITALEGRVKTKSVDLYTLVFSNSDKIEGGFQLTNFGLKSDHNNEQLYSGQLESSGSWTTTAV